MVGASPDRNSGRSSLCSVDQLVRSGLAAFSTARILHVVASVGRLVVDASLRRSAGRLLGSTDSRRTNHRKRRHARRLAKILAAKYVARAGSVPRPWRFLGVGLGSNLRCSPCGHHPRILELASMHWRMGRDRPYPLWPLDLDKEEGFCPPASRNGGYPHPSSSEGPATWQGFGRTKGRR